MAVQGEALRQLGLDGGASLERPRFVSSPEEAVRGAEFVQEHVPQREDLKRELFARLNAAPPPDVVLATNSSGLLVSRTGAATQNPGRVLVGHPFNPPT